MHVSSMQPPMPFSFALESTLIVWDSGGICKANFYDRAEVMLAAGELMRDGTVSCAICHGFLHLHGSYPRHCRDEEGKRHDGWIAQGCCAACDKYPALIPSFIKPYKHYRADIIEWVIGDAEEGNNVEDIAGCGADASTMRRWVREFNARGEQAARRLASLQTTARGAHASPPKLRGMPLLRQLARLLRAYPESESGGVIGRANIILTTNNCGFL